VCLLVDSNCCVAVAVAVAVAAQRDLKRRNLNAGPLAWAIVDRQIKGSQQAVLDRPTIGRQKVRLLRQSAHRAAVSTGVPFCSPGGDVVKLRVLWQGWVPTEYARTAIFGTQGTKYGGWVPEKCLPHWFLGTHACQPPLPIPKHIPGILQQLFCGCWKMLYLSTL